MRAALAMEWEKLRPVHKTSRTIALAIALAVTVSALVALAVASSASQMSSHDRLTFDSVGISLEGVNAAVLAVAAFGILSITREYANGMMAVTFLAQPARLEGARCEVAHARRCCGAGRRWCLRGRVRRRADVVEYRRSRDRLVGAGLAGRTWRGSRLPDPRVRVGHRDRGAGSHVGRGDHLECVPACRRADPGSGPAGQHGAAGVTVAAVTDRRPSHVGAARPTRIRALDRSRGAGWFRGDHVDRWWHPDGSPRALSAR